jgi:hypothetical protein
VQEDKEGGNSGNESPSWASLVCSFFLNGPDSPHFSPTRPLLGPCSPESRMLEGASGGNGGRRLSSFLLRLLPRRRTQSKQRTHFPLRRPCLFLTGLFSSQRISIWTGKEEAQLLALLAFYYFLLSASSALGDVRTAVVSEKSMFFQLQRVLCWSKLARFNRLTPCICSMKCPASALS